MNRSYFLTVLLSLLLIGGAAGAVFTTIEKLNQTRLDSVKNLVKTRSAEIAERVRSLRFNLELLSLNPSIKEIRKRDQFNASLVNYLKKLKEASGILAIYLMDSRGNCILSTNPEFLGKNYGFRPYFKDALKTGRGFYVAKGVTSKKIGLYLSKRVDMGKSSSRNDSMVMVFKVAPKSILSASPLILKEMKTWLATPNGVLFRPEARSFFSINPMPSAWHDGIRRMRQFEGQDIKSLGFPEGTWNKLISQGSVSAELDGKRFHIELTRLIDKDLFSVLILPEAFELPEYAAMKHAVMIMIGLFTLAVVPVCALLFYLRRQQLELAKSRSKIKLLMAAVEQAAHTVVITDKNGTIEYVNPAFSEITGFSKEEALGQNPRILKSGFHDAEFYENLWKTINSGKVWKGRFQNMKKDGSLYWEDAVISPLQNNDGQITHFIAIKSDVTDVVRLEHKLNKKLREWQAIMDHAGVGILLVRNRRILAANKMLATILSADEEELVGRQTRLFYHSEEEYQLIMRKWYPRLIKGETVAFEHKTVLPGGDLRHFQVVGKVSRPGNLETMETVWVLHDISEIKRLQKDLEAAKERAEAASRAKSEFLANMSHEIRTPLNGVIGMLHLLSSTSLDEDQKNYVAKAATSADILLAILNDILDFSKIEAGKLVLEEIDFNLHLLIEMLVSSMRLVAMQKNLDLRVDIDEHVVECLRGDSTRLRQVLMNLLSNAVKFTEEGWIELVVNQKREDKHGVELYFSVEDTGRGIPAEKREELFDEFTQVDASTTRKFGGTGLGLAISRKLVHLLGGEIGVESEIGMGTKFWFTACFKKGDTKSEGCQVRTQAALVDNKVLKRIKDHGCSKRVLVVDDNQVNQQVVVAMLRKLGIRAEAVSNGKEAVEALSVIPYDMVFMDIQMPIMDGMEATRKIKGPDSRAINPDIPVVALTAHAFREEIKQFMEAGMDDHLAKPVVPEKLIACLMKWLKCESGVGEEIDKPLSPSQETEKRGNEDDPPRFERQALDARTMGDKELKDDVINTFIQTTKDNIQLLKDAIQQENLEMIAERAHAIKGSSGNIAGMKLSALASKIEKSSRAGNRDTSKLEELEKMITGLEEEFGLLVKVLEAELESTS